MSNETASKDIPTEVLSEMERIRRLLRTDECGDREDLITYATEVVRLRTTHHRF